MWSATAAWNVQLADMELQDFASKLLAASKVFNCNSVFLIVRILCLLPKSKPKQQPYLA